MNRWLLAPALGLALAAATPVHAAPRVEADPNKEYPVHPQAGAWMILAANYKGPDAPELARQMALQLRSRDNLPAFVWSVTERKRAEQKAEEEAFHQRYPQLPFKRYHIDEEWGVLIGGFNDMDSAAKFLKDVVRKLPPPKLNLPGKSTADVMTFTEPDGHGRMVVRQGELNPFAISFVMRNPTLPTPKAEKKADPLLPVLNEDEEYSLLKCKEPWTISVQLYAGASTIVSGREKPTGFLDKLWGGKKDGSSLNAAALQAHETARFLRQLKFDAYVLHTRTFSLVTVGGFKGPDDPNLQRVQQQIAALKTEPLKLFAVPYEIPR